MLPLVTQRAVCGCGRLSCGRCDSSNDEAAFQPQSATEAETSRRRRRVRHSLRHGDSGCLQRCRGEQWQEGRGADADVLLLYAPDSAPHFALVSGVSPGRVSVVAVTRLTAAVELLVAGLCSMLSAPIAASSSSSMAWSRGVQELSVEVYAALEELATSSAALTSAAPTLQQRLQRLAHSPPALPNSAIPALLALRTGHQSVESLLSVYPEFQDASQHMQAEERPQDCAQQAAAPAERAVRALRAGHDGLSAGR